MIENNQNIELRSEEVQEILSAVPNWMIRWGNTLVLILLILFLLMSWFIKYPDIINTQVIVTTTIAPEKIYAKNTGKLTAFLVTDNQIITKDKPLAIIENSANYKDVLYLKSIIDTLKINYSRFHFPLEKMPILFLGDIDNSYALFETNYTNYILYKKLLPFSNDFIANNTSVKQSKKRLQIQLNQQEIYKQELALKKIDLNRSTLIFKKGIISKQEMELRQTNYLREERAFENSKISISNLQESISNSNQSLKGNEIKKIQEENRILKQVIQSYNQLKKAIKDWELRYVLNSSINGKITFLSVYSKTQSVKANDLIFTVIPSKNSSFIAKIKAPARNSGKLKIGQRVNIKLENYPSQEFGVLKGTVKNISLITNEDGNYLIDVSLPNNLITSYKKELEFKQEMQGTAEIITEDLRLIERFFYQIRSIFDN